MNNKDVKDILEIIINECAEHRTCKDCKFLEVIGEYNCPFNGVPEDWTVVING